MTNGRPRIGLTLDAEAPGSYSKFPWYALRRNYASSLAGLGAVPLPLPHEPELIETYLDLIDGLIVTGGAFDVDPALYGADERHISVSTKDERTAFELGITRGALDRDLPVLGICGGQQLLTVILGGDLIQHIPDAVPGALAHEQPNPRDEPGHGVRIEPRTRLAAITGMTGAEVNSAHHQAAGTLGPGVVASAVAPDGVIEAIEAGAYRFCIGVQWHPEFLISPADRALLLAFIEACRHG